MRNLRKLTAVVIAIALVLTSMTAAFAASTPANGAKAETLKSLGLYQGKDANDATVGLEDELTVEQGLTFLARLFGYDDEADALSDADVAAALEKFEDADQLSTFAKKIVAYSADKKIVEGKEVKGKLYIGAKDVMPGFRFATFILRQMGYTVDVTSEAVDQLAEVKGVDAAAVTESGDLTRDDAVGVMYAALTGETKAGATVIANIVGDNADLKAKAVAAGLIAAPTTLAVESVTAPNAKQIVVVFNKEVNKDTIVAASFEVFDNGSSTATVVAPALQSDNKTVILTLDGNSKLTNATNAKVVVKTDVKDAAGVALAAAYTKSDVLVKDTAMPTIVKLEPAGLKTFKVYFSEPVYDGVDATIANNQITVKSGIYTYVVNSITSDYAGKVLTVNVGTNLIEGDISVTINAQGMADAGAIRDFAGLVALKSTETMTFAIDTTPAVVTLDSVNKATGKAVVKFSKLVYGTNVKLFHSVSGAAAYGPKNGVGVTKSIAAAGDSWEFEFANALPSGKLTFFLVNDPDVAGNQLTDLYGVKVPNQTFTYEVITDVTPPTVSEVKINTNASFDVVFSEDVDSTEATKADNFEILKADGSKLNFNMAAQPDAKTARLTATLEDGATYTVNVKAMKDVAGNAMAAAYSVQKTIGDNTAPTVADKYIVGTNTIYIVYSEAMNETDITAKSSYLVAVSTATPGFKPLGDNDKVELVSNKKVKITWNDNNLVAGQADVQIGAVKDLAGKRLGDETTFVTTISNIPASELNLYDAQLIAANKIKIIFNKEIGSFDPGEFAIRQTGGSITSPAYAFTSVESNVVNGDGRSEVVLVLDADVKYDAKDNEAQTLKVITTGGAINTKSVELTVLKSNDSKAIADKLAPVVDKIVITSGTAIYVYFKENLNKLTFAGAGVNGFSVAGGTLTSVALANPNADGNVVILTGTDFTVNTDVSYNGTNGIKDLNDNALAAFTHTDALKTTP